jgi:hypothetical protein
MKHEKIIWEPGAREWVCAQCGRSSDQTNVHAAHAELDQYDCRPASGEAPTADPGTETALFTRKPLSAFSTAPKTERSGSRFRANIGEGKPVIELELFHDTVSGLRSVSVGFELLSGTTLEQAKRLVDGMNERIVGVIVTSK